MEAKKIDEKELLEKESIKSDNDLNLEAFGKRVKELRQSQNLSQKDVARALGISAAYLSEIEKGKRKPGLDFFVGLSRELGAGLDYIITGTGPVQAAGVETREKDPLQLEDVIDTSDINLLMEHSSLFRNTLLGFAARFFMDNERIIKQNMENLKKGKEPQVALEGKKRE